MDPNFVHARHFVAFSTGVDLNSCTISLWGPETLYALVLSKPIAFLQMTNYYLHYSGTVKHGYNTTVQYGDRFLSIHI